MYALVPSHTAAVPWRTVGRVALMTVSVFVLGVYRTISFRALPDSPPKMYALVPSHTALVPWRAVGSAVLIVVTESARASPAASHAAVGAARSRASARQARRARAALGGRTAAGCVWDMDTRRTQRCGKAIRSCFNP